MSSYPVEGETVALILAVVIAAAALYDRDKSASMGDKFALQDEGYDKLPAVSQWDQVQQRFLPWLLLGEYLQEIGLDQVMIDKHIDPDLAAHNNDRTWHVAHGSERFAVNQETIEGARNRAHQAAPNTLARSYHEAAAGAKLSHATYISLS